MSTPTTYRAAVIGLGFIGAGDQVSGDKLGQNVRNLDGTHAGTYAKNPRIALVAGSSRDEGRRHRFEQTFRQPTFADWRDMLAAVKPDIVSVATYTPVHEEITVACAQAGVKAVYCEKPMAATVDQCCRMIAACDRAATLLVIAHNRRFNPNYRRLRDLIAQGGLGELISVHVQWGTGRLGNLGSHLFDAITMLTGRRITAVTGTLDTGRIPDCRGPEFFDPGGWGVLRLTGDLFATVNAPDAMPKHFRLAIHGSLATAVTGRDEITIDYLDGRNEHWPSTRAQATSFDHAAAEIVDYLDGKRPFACDPRDSAHVLEAIVAFHVSHHRRGEWVTLPLATEDRHRVLRSG